MTIKKKVRKESAFKCRVLFCVLFMGRIMSIIQDRNLLRKNYRFHCLKK